MPENAGNSKPFLEDESGCGSVVESLKGEISWKKVDALLRESEEAYHALVNISRDAIFTGDEEGRIVFLNRVAMKMFGYSEEEARGRNLFKLIASAEDSGEMRKKVREQEKLYGGELYAGLDHFMELTAARKDGTEFPIELSLFRRRTSRGWWSIAVIRDVTERLRGIEALKARLEFEKAISAMAYPFVHPSDFDKSIKVALSLAGRVSEADRAYIFLINKDGINIDNTHEWCAEGVSPQINNLRNIPMEDIPWWMGGLREKGIIDIEDVSLLPPEANTECEMLERQGIRSLLVLPLYARGNIRGFIGFDDVREARKWSGESKTLLGVLAGTLGSALHRWEVEEELRENERRYRTIFENTGTAMALVEGNMTISLANENMATLTGYSRVEIENKKKWTDFIHPDDLEMMKEHHRRRRKAKDGVPLQFEFRMVDRAGGVKYIYLTMDMIAGTKKSIASMLNITQLKSGEEALRQSEERYQKIVEGTSDVIFTLDRECSFSFMSSQFEEITGYPCRNFIGHHFAEVLAPEYRESTIERFRRGLAGEKISLYEVELLFTNGRRIPVELSMDSLLDRNGKVVGRIGIARDISERKKTHTLLERSFAELAETTSRAMAFRDPYTADHQRRVAEMARMVGQKMGLGQDILQGLYIGGLLHDIGKISIPESILTRPGALGEEEWALVRSHARRGYEILKDTTFPWPVAEMALQHHERLDGSGYPEGISGDEIILEARILGVCDVVESMGSHRPYRPARNQEEVVEEIKEGRGSKYDAVVVDMMLEIIESGEMAELVG